MSFPLFRPAKSLNIQHKHTGTEEEHFSVSPCFTFILLKTPTYTFTYHNNLLIHINRRYLHTHTLSEGGVGRERTGVFHKLHADFLHQVSAPCLLSLLLLAHFAELFCQTLTLHTRWMPSTWGTNSPEMQVFISVEICNFWTYGIWLRPQR